MHPITVYIYSISGSGDKARPIFTLPSHAEAFATDACVIKADANRIRGENLYASEQAWRRDFMTIKKPAHYPSAGNCPWGSPSDGLTYTVDLDSEKRLISRKALKSPRGRHVVLGQLRAPVYFIVRGDPA
jgi:hypothetical protein